MIAKNLKSATYIALLFFWLCSCRPADAQIHAQSAPVEATSAQSIPIHVKLDHAAYVTLVIDNTEGRRVRNLIAETLLPPGDNVIPWDGCDDRGQLVQPGDYRINGLTHDGIRLYYEMAYDTGGNPPWSLKDHTGAWMADHSLPNTAVYLPAGLSPYADGKPQIMLAGIVAECGDPVIFVDESGQKVYGNHYFGWDGAVAGARDIAATGQPDVFVYMLMGWQGKKLNLRGINRKSQGIEITSIPTNNDMPREPASIGIGLAVFNGLAVVSIPLDNQLAFVNIKTRQVVGKSNVDAPKGVAFDSTGKLLVISGKTVKRYRIAGGPDSPSLTDEQTVVADGLEAPYGLALDPQNNIYVTDQGNSHQVKFFTAAGRFVRTIGKPGGPQLGHYDDQRMQNPEGLAIDSKGRIWVGEYDAWPKRVSIWNAAGRLIDAKYGPPQYGGGGTIDPQDKSRLFFAQYGNITEWKINWQNGTVKLVNISVRRQLMGAPDDIARWHFEVPERPVHLNGRTYLVPTYGGFLRWNSNSPIYMVGDDGIAWPVAFVGTLRRWGHLGMPGLDDVAARYPKDPNLDTLTNYNDTVVAWSDLNFDHKIQADEFTFRQFPNLTITNAQGQKRRLNRKELTQCFDDLSANLAWNMHIDAPKFDDKGVPIYDLATIKPMVPPLARDGGNEEGGGGITNNKGQLMPGLFTAMDRARKVIWSYPVLEGHALPQKGGDVNEPVRLLGPMVVAKRGQAGEWMAINGERGNIFLMTTDGLFIQTLSGSLANTPVPDYPKAVRGMLFDSPEKHVSFQDEHFHPSITQTKDGEIYLCAGKEYSAIFRVDGFDNIKRMSTQSLALSSDMIAQLPRKVTRKADDPTADKFPAIISTSPIKVDGHLDDWSGSTAWVALDSKASAAMRTVGDKMYLAFRTGDPNAIDNDASNYRFMFKNGGALDLQIRPDNLMAGAKQLLGQDRRLLIANVHGKMTAVLFFPDPSDTPGDGKILYESPIGKVYFNRVEDVSNKVQVAGDAGNFEVGFPMSLVDMKPPHAGQEALGDIGIIRGNGSQNLQRLYWHNRDTMLISDIPSEARMVPGNWGRFRFTPDTGVSDGSILLAPEKAKLVGKRMQLKKLPMNEFAIGFWDSNDDYLQWTDVPAKPGTYTVELTYGKGNNIESSFVFNCGEQALPGSTKDTGGWDTYTTMSLGKVTITEDKASFTLKPVDANGGLMDFKAIRLIPAKP